MFSVHGESGKKETVVALSNRGETALSDEEKKLIGTWSKGEKVERKLASVSARKEEAVNETYLQFSPDGNQKETVSRIEY